MSLGVCLQVVDKVPMLAVGAVTPGSRLKGTCTKRRTGVVIPGTGIAVDFWKVRQDIRYYFLTHSHGDHIAGLTSTRRKPIYCSPVTANILEDRHGVDRSLLHTLEVGQSHVVWNKEKARPLRSDFLTVTVLDANHCPGSVMYLFEGSFGKILHTGDFRYQPSMVDVSSLLFRHIGSIDKLYLDNTYCHPKFEHFPSREKATKQVLAIARRHSEYDIVIGLRRLGKEELIEKVGLELKERVGVRPEMLKLVQTLELRDVFKPYHADDRVRVLPFQEVTRKYMQELNKTKPTIAILPTALYQASDGRPSASSSAEPSGIKVVPYSDHSSFQELKRFVLALRPAAVEPIVWEKKRDGTDVTDMKCFQPFLSPPRTSALEGRYETSSLSVRSQHTSTYIGYNAQSTTASEITSSFEQQSPKRPKPKSRPRSPRKRNPIHYQSDEEDPDRHQTQKKRKQDRETAAKRSQPMTRNKRKRKITDIL